MAISPLTPEQQKLVEDNWRLVPFFFNKHFKRLKWIERVGEEEDCLQEGYIALIKAVRKYVPAKSKFSQYFFVAYKRHLWNKINSGGVVTVPPNAPPHYKHFRYNAFASVSFSKNPEYYSSLHSIQSKDISLFLDVDEVHSILQKMTEEDRDVFYRKFWLGEEASVIYNRPSNVAGYHLRRLLQRFRDLWIESRRSVMR